MSTCLDKLPHSCGTKKGLQVFGRDDGTVDGFCFSCGKYIRNPYGDERKTETLPTPKVKTDDEIKEELYEVATYPTLTIESRKLRSDVLELFNVKTSVSESDGKTPTAAYYPYTKKGKITGYRVKSLDGSKKFFSIGDLKDVDLFGWDRAVESGAKRLIITEGEDDAIALTKIIERNTKDQYKEFMPAVVSLTHGSASAKKCLTRMKNEINKHFREVVFCFDQDEPGEKAVKEAKLVLPQAQVANLPLKDAQECLAEGKSRAAFNAVTFNIQEVKNTKLVFGSDLHLEARKEPTWGDLTWPWSKLNETTRGIRFGETIYIGAG